MDGPLVVYINNLKVHSKNENVLHVFTDAMLDRCSVSLNLIQRKCVQQQLVGVLERFHLVDSLKFISYDHLLVIHFLPFGKGK